MWNEQYNARIHRRIYMDHGNHLIFGEEWIYLWINSIKLWEKERNNCIEICKQIEGTNSILIFHIIGLFPHVPQLYLCILNTICLVVISYGLGFISNNSFPIGFRVQLAAPQLCLTSSVHGSPITILCSVLHASLWPLTLANWSSLEGRQTRIIIRTYPSTSLWDAWDASNKNKVDF